MKLLVEIEVPEIDRVVLEENRAEWFPTGDAKVVSVDEAYLPVDPTEDSYRLFRLVAVDGEPFEPERSGWAVDDLQTVEPDAFPKVEGIEVVLDSEKDRYGFDRATVYGPTRTAVVEYVRLAWGDEDPEWFKEWVEDRVGKVGPVEASA